MSSRRIRSSWCVSLGIWFRRCSCTPAVPMFVFCEQGKTFSSFYLKYWFELNLVKFIIKLKLNLQV